MPAVRAAVSSMARRRRQHLVGVLVLQVVDAGHGARRLCQLRVLERVGDLLAVQPDLAGVAAQAVQELLAGAGGCRRLLLRGCHHASWCVSGGSCSPLASRPSRSWRTASSSKRKYDRGGRMPQTLLEWG